MMVERYVEGKAKFFMKLNRSVKDGSPRLLFDYVLKEMEVKVGKAQYHAMMRVQSSLKFLELARYVKLRGGPKQKKGFFWEIYQMECWPDFL